MHQYKQHLGRGSGQGSVVVVKWSACLSSSPTILVQILLKSTVFFCKLFEQKENKQKRVIDGPFKKVQTKLRLVCD